MEEELKHIKRIYGENFMHLCRRLFSTVLEDRNKLLGILQENFSENCKTLAEDIEEQGIEEDFRAFILNKANINEPEEEIVVEESPYELFEKIGYTLYECKTEEDIQKFKKYYEKYERLCTFNGGRLDTHVVFFAVKNDIDKIKRIDFTNPKREDEYGTSILGIQFNRERKMCCINKK